MSNSAWQQSTAIVTKSRIPVERITGVYLIEIKDFFEKRAAAMTNSPEIDYDEFTIAAETNGPPIKIKWSVEMKIDGTTSLSLSGGPLLNEQLPMVVRSHVVKNCIIKRSSQRHQLFLRKEYAIIDVIEPKIDHLIENGCLNIRLEIFLLPCCLSVGGQGGQTNYKGFEEGNCSIETLESLKEDMACMRIKMAGFSDLEIICQGKKFQVHKAFLSARSDVFLGMLSHDTKEAKEGQIEITDADPETVENFLGYLYEAKVPSMNVEQASSLMMMADKYNVRALVAACQDHLLENIKDDNVVQILILGYLCKKDELKNAAISMMAKKVGPLKELEDWSKLEGYPKLLMEILDQIKG